MIKSTLLSGCAVLCWYSSAAQHVAGAFESLPINAAPAYVILGVDPENIQRPGTPGEFTAGAQSAIVNGRLQPNVAMEATPYFWFHATGDSMKFSAAEFLGNTRWGQNLLRSITFSVATSPSDTVTFGGLAPGTGLGGGVRMQLVSGRISSTTRARLTALLRNAHAIDFLSRLYFLVEDEAGNVPDIDRELAKYIDSRRGDAEFQESLRNLEAVVYTKLLIGKNSLNHSDAGYIDSLQRAEREKGTANQRVLTTIPVTREGFLLELSAAAGTVAEDSRWDRISYGRTAIWLTPSYRINIAGAREPLSFLDIMAVARVTFNSADVDRSSYLDAGIKLQWIHNRFSLAGEGIYRYATETPAGLARKYTYRADLSIGYKINDNITFKATAGTNFDGNTATYSDPKRIFAVGGFNFGFGNLLR